MTARKRLLDAAVDAFAENGFAGTTTREIASRAQMSPAAVYVHHDSKEELLFAVSVDGHREALRVIEAAAASTDDPVERVQVMVSEFSAWHAAHSRIGRIIHNEYRSLTPQHRSEVAVFRRQIEQEMQAALSAGVTAGVLDVDDVPGTAFVLLSLGIDIVRWFETDGPQTAESLARLHADLALKMTRAS